MPSWVFLNNDLLIISRTVEETALIRFVSSSILFRFFSGTAYLNLAMERLNHNFFRSPPWLFQFFVITFGYNDLNLFSLVSSFLPLLLLRTMFQKKVNTFNLNFTTFIVALWTFFLFDLTYIIWLYFLYTVRPLNSGQLQVLKNLCVIERCPLLGGNLKKTVPFGKTT